MGSSTEKDLKAIAGAKTLTNIPWCEDYERMISGMLWVLLRSLPTCHNTGFTDITQFQLQSYRT